MLERGVVKITLGGRERTLRARIQLVSDIEDATGKGLTALTSELLSNRGRLTDAAHVLRIALNDAGTHVSLSEVFDMIETDGITTGYIAAGMFLGAFYPTRGASNSQKKATTKT